MMGKFRLPFNFQTKTIFLFVVKLIPLFQIWGPNTFNWKENFAVHIWYRIWRDMSPYYIGEDVNPENIKTMNNTFGAMARSIYYGTSEIIPADTFS